MAQFLRGNSHFLRGNFYAAFYADMNHQRHRRFLIRCFPIFYIFLLMQVIPGMAIAAPHRSEPLPSSVNTNSSTRSYPPPVNIGITGVYSGLIPCADCEGIQYRLALSGDGSYQEQLTYKGKSSKPYIGRGRYTLEGDTLVKLNKKTAGMSLFRVHPKGLLMLDADGQPITGDLADHYILMKLTRGPGTAVQNPGKIKKALLYSKWRSGIGFYATGEEQSWSLDLNFRKFMRFITPEGDTIVTPPSKGARAMDVNMIRYYSETSKGTLTIQILLKDCLSTMSNEKSDYQVMVDWKGPTDADTRHFTGCGNYTPDFRLDGKWVLQNMNGKTADSASYPRGLPTLEFRVAEGRFSGNAGCNGMMGKVSRREDQGLVFSQAATTLMFCPNMDKEKELLTALDRVNGYQLTRSQLQLTMRGEVILVFSRSMPKH